MIVTMLLNSGCFVKNEPFIKTMILIVLLIIFQFVKK